MRSRLIGTVPLDPGPLAPELEHLLTHPMQTCARYAVGNWGKWILFLHDPPGPPQWTALGRELAGIRALIEQRCDLGALRLAQLFFAADGGFLRPHRDWPSSEPIFTRLHLPLRSDTRSLVSESEEMFRMLEGEVWYLAADVPHSVGCFSARGRIHLVMDFQPGAEPNALMRVEPLSAGGPGVARVDRRAFGQQQLDAIHRLTSLADRDLFDLVTDLLGAVHFDWTVDGADSWSWLAEIARRKGDPHLVQRSDRLRGFYLDGKVLDDHAASGYD